MTEVRLRRGAFASLPLRPRSGVEGFIVRVAERPDARGAGWAVAAGGGGNVERDGLVFGGRGRE